MDINRALRTATQTGTVLMGFKETRRAVEDKKAKLVILSRNAPEDDVQKLNDLATQNGIPVYNFHGLNTELGPACGKPFSVAVLSVLDAGESDVLALGREA